MRSLICALLIAACAEAAIVFKNSYLIDETDLKNNPNGYAFVCPGNGCTVYTTKMDQAEVGIYDGATLKATLDAIYIKDKDGFLTGYHLNAGTNYKLMKSGALVNANNAVKIYIVADIAGTGAVTDFDSVTNEKDISGSGKKTVTLLNVESSGVTFSGYKGTTAPKIYSAGFDVVGSCKPIYTASSVDNAAASKIGIVSALITIDFGSTDDNKYHAAKHVANANTVAIGQSAVVMSPGYTGCLIDHNYNDFAMASYDFKSSSANTKAWINFGDISISQGHELTVKVTGQSDLKIGGSTAQNYAYVADNIDVNVSWDQKGQNDYFFAQIDFTNGVAHVFGVSTIFALIAALM